MGKKRIWAVSSKGGVGKSTLCVNLARAVAAMGKPTLLIDLDTACRTLDMLLGVEDTAVYDVADVVGGRVDIRRAVVNWPGSENLFLLCGAADPAFAPSATALDEVISLAEAELHINFTVIDTHAPDGNAPALAAVVTDTLVLTTPDAMSIRAAELCGMRMRELQAPGLRLVINKWEPRAPRQPSLLSVVDGSAIRLLGVIPRDGTLNEAQQKGQLAKDTAEDNTICAFRNVALRLLGETVPLFSDFRGIDRKKCLGL